MNKEEFLSQLEAHLSGMPENEKQEALQYYRDYFEDAGKEKENDILASLGSPAEVAENIKEENQSGEWTERGYCAEHQSADTCIVKTDAVGGQNTENQQNIGNQQNAGPEPAKKEDKAGIILAIVLVVVLSPVWISLLGGLFGTLVALIGGFIGFMVSGAALFIVSIPIVIGSICAMVAGLPVPIGLMLIGAGLMIGAIGILLIFLTVLIIRYAIPALIKGIKSLWNMIFKRREASK
ncbi:MAG: DUF1700 domain-containing protein [Lachnospiraceae bacterium]|nr:DUF1700 domain-containing protein [Lachnospiraceae bacterium]